MIGIKLDRPLVILDTETTGVDKDIDRIVQIAVIRVEANGSEDSVCWLLNPGVPIPPEATAIHGITDGAVSGAREFSDRYPELMAWLKGADFCAYNAPFDLGMLEAECKRARLPVYKPERIIDPLVIYRAEVPHTLVGALMTYTSQAHLDAHDALGDCKATLQVLRKQLELGDLKTIDAAIAASVPPKDERFADSGRWFYFRFGLPTFAFGKHKGTAINRVDRGYLNWMLGQDIPDDTKSLVKRALAGESCKREVPAEVGA